MPHVRQRLSDPLPGSRTEPASMHVRKLRQQRRSVLTPAAALPRRHSLRVRLAGDYNVLHVSDAEMPSFRYFFVNTAWVLHSFYVRQLCFARLSHGLGVRLSVCHILEPYQNGASYDHKIFTLACHKDFSLK